MKRQKLGRIHGAVFGQPWMITTEWLDTICAIVSKHEAGNSEALKNWKSSRSENPLLAQGRDGNGDGNQSDYEVQNGVAVLRLFGPIFPRANMLTNFSGATSLEEFSNNFNDALDNPAVKALVIHIDSPGGSCFGLDTAAQMIYDARQGQKPIFSMAEGMACSAAYYLGSQADAFYATAGSLLGSIGVVSQLCDYSRQEANEGVDVTTLKTGSLKAVGVGPVTDDQIDHMREISDGYFQQFKDAVARARPRININQVATGRVWLGRQAVAAGLVDGISTLDDVINELS